MQRHDDERPYPYGVYGTPQAIRLSLPPHGPYVLRQNGRDVPLVQTGDADYAWRAEVDVASEGSRIELVRR